VVTIQQEHDQLEAKVRNAMEWLDTPGRDKKEIDKWINNYKTMFDKLTQLERMRRNGNVRR